MHDNEMCPRFLYAFLLSILWLPNVVVAQDSARLAIIEFSGDINPLSEQIFLRKLEKAREAGVEFVVVEIDSPGGFVDSSLNLAAALRDADWATTVAYVPRRALSGAAIMALGCDQIVMSRKGRIGDAGPIFMDEDFMFRYTPEKIVSDLVRQVRDLSTEHGRPPAIAEAMVDKDTVVYRVTDQQTGEVQYMSDAEIESSEDPDQLDKGPPILASKKGMFLTINGEQAVKFGFANELANSREELFAQYEVQPQETIVLEATWVDGLVFVLNSTPATILLIIIGLIAFYLEFGAPGIGVGALVGSLCFALFFWSRSLGGTAGWLEVVLFLAGIAFILMEIFVIPGTGFAGIGGILLLGTSLVMASQRFSGIDGFSLAQLARSVLVILAAMVTSMVGMVLLSHRLGSVPGLRRLQLEPPTVAISPQFSSHSDKETSEEDWLPAVGDQGIADSMLRPAGRVLFQDQFVDVVTDGSFVEKGCTVRVIRVNGSVVMVRET